MSAKKERFGPILRTKLHRPSLTTDFVDRNRLTAMLEKYPDRALTLISAPAGYGKSTLAASWLEKTGRPGVWVSLDNGDDDLRSFLLYICMAIQSLFPESMKALENALAAPSLPPADAVEKCLLNGISAIEEPFILAIDDYQSITEKSIHELLSVLVEYNIPSLHIALLTRRDPPLPLHKFRGRGIVTEISMKDLIFTPAETRDFLFKAIELDIGDENSNVLEEKMEGWATGLRLISSAVSGREDLDRIIVGLSGSYKTLTDYLVSEVLSTQPASVIDRLLVASVSERFNVELVDFLCESDDPGGADTMTGESFMARLQKSNLFVIPLDYEGYWFRYHHLFRDMLFSKLEQEWDPSEIAHLHRKAARWFVDHELVEEAIRQALLAGEKDVAVEIITNNRHAALDDDNYYILTRWLDLLPGELVIDSPELLMTKTWVFFHKLDIPGIVGILGMFERFIDRDDLADGIRGEYSFFNGFVQYLMMNGPESIAHLEKALELIPETESQTRRAAELHYSLSRQMVNGTETALSDLDSFLGSRRKINSMHRGRLVAGKSFLGHLDLNLKLAAQSASRAGDIAEKEDLDYVRAWARYLGGIAHHMWNDLDKAIELCSGAVELRHVFNTSTMADNYAMLVLSHMHNGQADKAAQALLSLISYSEDIDDPGCTGITMSVRARYSLLRGDLESAVRWLRTVDLASHGGLMMWWIEVPRITACRVLIAEGTSLGLERAVSMLEDFIKENAAVKNLFQQVVMLPLLAVALYKQGQADEAVEAMKSALELAEASSVIAPFMEFRPEMIDILRMVCEKDSKNEFAGRLIETINRKEPVSGPEKGRADAAPSRIASGDFLMEALTNRELAALKCLAKGLYYKEIADEMAVSKDTIKTHLRHVYQKLQVENRREAVAMARKLGILDPTP